LLETMIPRDEQQGNFPPVTLFYPKAEGSMVYPTGKGERGNGNGFLV